MIRQFVAGLVSVSLVGCTLQIGDKPQPARPSAAPSPAATTPAPTRGLAFDVLSPRPSTDGQRIWPIGTAQGLATFLSSHGAADAKVPVVDFAKSEVLAFAVTNSSCTGQHVASIETVDQGLEVETELESPGCAELRASSQVYALIKLARTDLAVIGAKRYPEGATQ
ncbi:MAG: hypothetical protein JWM80_104 [Cyanobacteria bacterium RYN_339]|nr:hypothetical protein [Cyanobacteria bacterium RYN_339]